jgi:hypothetical protein
MTIVREEENGNNGHRAGGVWRGGRCPSSLDTRAGASRDDLDRCGGPGHVANQKFLGPGVVTHGGPDARFECGVPARPRDHHGSKHLPAHRSSGLFDKGRADPASAGGL